jgi:ankyrin repeat protein
MAIFMFNYINSFATSIFNFVFSVITKVTNLCRRRNIIINEELIMPVNNEIPENLIDINPGVENLKLHIHNSAIDNDIKTQLLKIIQDNQTDDKLVNLINYSSTCLEILWDSEEEKTAASDIATLLLRIAIDKSIINKQTINLIDKFNADITTTGNDGINFFHRLCGHDEQESIDGYTSLHYVLQYINKMDINIQDQSGMTPLHYACISENLATVAILVSNNADTAIVDKRQFNASNMLLDGDDSDLIKQVLKNQYSFRDNLNKSRSENKKTV